ncbi:nipblb [Symbiodinium sp. CCMP2592]|nr:nipblb [Symbiodinium sp. CCMP2592]
MIADLLRWLETLDQSDVAVHIQLPPVLTPLREVLNSILHGGTNTNWHQLVAVGDALEVLVAGQVLSHPADVVTQNDGGTESNLLPGTQPVAGWSHAVDVLHAIRLELPSYPQAFLPTVQEAAMNLLWGISRLIPEEEHGQPGQAWWTSDRHHGWGDGTASFYKHLPAHGPEAHAGRDHPPWKRGQDDVGPTIAIEDDECWQSTYMNEDCEGDQQNEVLHDYPILRMLT